MIAESERQRLRRAYSIGPRMIGYLETIGIETLAELATADAVELAFRTNVHLGRRHINRAGIAALDNLIALAKSEARPMSHGRQ